jgi:hypothetical protein
MFQYFAIEDLQSLFKCKMTNCSEKTSTLIVTSKIERKSEKDRHLSTKSYYVVIIIDENVQINLND